MGSINAQPRSVRRVQAILVTTAVVVTTASIAWAALPSRSVGSSQLKRSAVTSTKVKNGTLSGADFRESSLSPVPRATASAARFTFSRVYTATTGGVDEDTARAASAKRTMFQQGSLTVYAKCWINPATSHTTGEIHVSTSGPVTAFTTSNGDYPVGPPYFNAGAPEDTSRLIFVSAALNSAEGDRDYPVIVDAAGDVIAGDVFVYVRRGVVPGGNGIYRAAGDRCAFVGSLGRG